MEKGWGNTRPLHFLNNGMVKKSHNFLLTVWIKDSDGKIKKLTKKQSLILDWEKSPDGKKGGKGTGYLNPGSWEKVHSELTGNDYYTRNSQGEIIEFENNGKKYLIKFKLEVYQGLLKNFVGSFSAPKEVPGSDFTIYREKTKNGLTSYSNEYLQPNKKRKADEERERRMGGSAKILDWNGAGIAKVSAVVLVIIITLIFLIIWIRRRKRKKLAKTSAEFP